MTPKVNTASTKETTTSKTLPPVTDENGKGTKIASAGGVGKGICAKKTKDDEKKKKKSKKPKEGGEYSDEDEE